jgi:hypothetical protein
MKEPFCQKVSPKTLEERLIEVQIPYISIARGQVLFLDRGDVLDAIREWLEQKLDTLDGRLEYYHSNEPEQMQTLGKVKVLKELLGELSVPAEETKEGKTP